MHHVAIPCAPCLTAVDEGRGRPESEIRTMSRRSIPLVVLLALAAAAPAAADLHHRKDSVDAQLGAVQQKIAAARAREQKLQAEISSTTTRIRTLEARVGDVATRLSALRNDLSLRRARLDRIEHLYRAQTERLSFLTTQRQLATRRLARRLVEIYESDDPSTLEIMLGARSLQDAIDRVEYAQAVADQDRRIVAAVTTARRSLVAARQRTRRLRDSVRSETRIVEYRVAQAAAVQADLQGAQSALSATRESRQHDLAVTQDSEKVWQGEANSLRATSAALQAQIAAAQAAPPPATSPGAPPPSASPTPPTPSVGGMIWPVSGPITSPFGMRWGSLHPGLDIGAPMGTPIRAAAAGRVLVASYDGGYGNLVVLDNGGSIATAYAHQSSIAVTVGQEVAQGQVIGYVGSTGFSTGPHLHFEVRVNGVPVDPLGYL